MAILNLGSINIDHVYQLPHLPVPGETLASSALTTGLGGKGANQSIAAAKAGADIWHLGAVGPDGGWCTDRLSREGVRTEFVATLDVPTGHAIINVDAAGENAIVLFEGANRALSKSMIDAALERFTKGDWLLFQNETNLTSYAAQQAQSLGMSVAYAAAPFDADAVRAVLDHVDFLAVNAVEAAQLSEALGVSVEALPLAKLLVTRGAEGADYRADGKVQAVPALRVDPVDTTGAGDTFLGYFLAGLDRGGTSMDALRLASAASALQVTRPGAADAIPALSEVENFRLGLK